MGFRCFHARLHNPWINQEAVPGKRLLGSCLFLSRIAPTKLCLSFLACVAASVTGMNPLEAKKLLDLAFCHSWLLQANLKPKHLALFKDSIIQKWLNPRATNSTGLIADINEKLLFTQNLLSSTSHSLLKFLHSSQLNSCAFYFPCSPFVPKLG